MYYHRGSITVLVLVMLVVFAIILGVSIQFISRQAHETIVQEQEEQTFAAAEAGIQHVIWLLHPQGGGYTADRLRTQPPASLVNHPLTNTQGVVLAYFSVTVTAVSGGEVSIRSVGRDSALALCQTIEAELVQEALAGVRLEQWDHRPGVACTPGVAAADIRYMQLGEQSRYFLRAQDGASEFIPGQAHVFAFAGQAGQRIQVMVHSTSFIPHLVLRDGEGSMLASSGAEWLSPQVRLAALRENLRASLAAFSGQESPEQDACGSRSDRVCLPGGSEATLTLPADGVFFLEVGGWGGTGVYDLSTSVQ